MNMRKILAVVMALAMLLALCACGAQTATAPAEPTAAPAPAEPAAEPVPETPAEPEPYVTITDMTGREISLAEPATRVVALSAADCEVLFAIGAGDTLVGRGEYCDYPEEVFAVPSVQSGYDTNIEQIIALEPQVLLMSSMAQTEEQIAALEAAGITVVVSEAFNIEGVYQSVEMIGKLMGREDNARQVIEDMKATFADLAEKAAAVEGEEPTVYFEISPLEWGLWTAGTGTFYDEIASMLGMKNIFSDVENYGEISEEQVIERAPDVIVTITMYFGEGPTPEEEIMGRAGWEDVPAVRDGRILDLPNNELSRPVPRLAEGAQMLFDFVYGDAVENAA